MQILNVGHTDAICSIVQITHEKIASRDAAGKIIIWKIANGECLKTIEAHPYSIWDLVKLLVVQMKKQ